MTPKYIAQSFSSYASSSTRISAVASPSSLLSPFLQGFWVEGFGIRALGLAFTMWGIELRTLWLRVYGLGLGIYDRGCGASGLGSRLRGFGFSVVLTREMAN